MPFPNVDTQFQPGQSGNPAGRPKSRTMTERLRAALDRVGDDGLDMGETVILQWLAMIGDGNFTALTELVSRIDGPLVNSAKLEHGGKISIEVVYADADSQAPEATPSPADDPS